MIDKQYYAFIQMEDENIDAEAIIKMHLERDNNTSSYYFRNYYDYLPSFLEDSFSTGFVEAASRLNKKIRVTVATRI